MDDPILKSIESSWKTFIGIQEKVRIECVIRVLCVSFTSEIGIIICIMKIEGVKLKSLHESESDDTSTDLEVAETILLIAKTA